MDAVKITYEEFEKQYYPVGGFVFIKKDPEAEKGGGIWRPQSVRIEHTKWSTMGTVIRKSFFTMFEDAVEAYMHQKIEPGDRIGFSNTVPIYAPSPPYYEFEGEEREGI